MCNAVITTSMCIVLVITTFQYNHIGGVVFSVLASSVVDRGFIGDVVFSVLAASSAIYRGFEPWSLQTSLWNWYLLLLR
jgi:hypothetical protein